MRIVSICSQKVNLALSLACKKETAQADKRAAG
jgi:hypothetical protein